MKKTALFTIIGLAALMGMSTPSDAQRVLFIGNSLIGYDDMPALFAHLAASTGHKAYVEEYIWYGHTLQEQETRKDIQTALSSEKWDYVVVQEYSTRPLTNPKHFQKSLADFDALAKAAGARTVLLENWALKGEQTFAQITAAYTTANQSVGALIVPLAQAWDTVNSHSTINLYRDGKHPTPIATYMAACVLYGEIYKQIPTGLPHDGIDIIPQYPAGTYGGIPQPRNFINLDASAGADNVTYVQSVAAGVINPSQSK